MIVTLMMVTIVRLGGFLGTNGKEDGADEDVDGDELTSRIPSIIA